MLRLPEKRIASGRVLGLRTGRMTSIALADGINKIAAQSYEFFVDSDQVVLVDPQSRKIVEVVE